MTEHESDSIELGSNPAAAPENSVTSGSVTGIQQPDDSFTRFSTPEPVDSPLDTNPEIVVGAALLGGFLLGRLVKRLGS